MNLCYLIYFIFVYFLPQTFFVRDGTSAFLLDFHRFCGAIEERLRHFLPHWLRTGWQNVIFYYTHGLLRGFETPGKNMEAV